MTVININNISGIASVNAQSNSLELFDNTGASLLDLNVNTATFPGGISVGGTVTYDDVTNIDSVGVITARSGVHVTSGSVGIGTDDPTGTNALTDNTSTLAVGIATVGALHVNGNAYPSAGPLSNRNLIVNGAMRISQRATSATGEGYTTLDRWKFGYTNSVSLQITTSQSTDSPEGFANSLKIDIDTADTFTADEEFWVEQVIEGQDVQHFAYGSSSAKDVTLSFWVKSYVAGQYSVWFYSQDSTRYFMTEYTVNASATWEYKTVTIPGDTVGVINNDNGAGFQTRFYLGSGANYQTTVSTDWAANAQGTRTTSNQVQLQSSTDNYWQITGVQLELGSVATPFEHLTYNDDLAKCQRYYLRYNNDDSAMGLNFPGYYNTASTIYYVVHFPVNLRDVNIELSYSNLTHFDIEPWDYAITSLTLDKKNSNFATLTGGSTNRSQGDIAFLTLDETTGWIAFESEL